MTARVRVRPVRIPNTSRFGPRTVQYWGVYVDNEYQGGFATHEEAKVYAASFRRKNAHS